MKLLLHPGGALFVLAGLAFVVRLISPSLPILSGLVGTVALFAMLFGFIGGVFLTLAVRKGESPA